MARVVVIILLCDSALGLVHKITAQEKRFVPTFSQCKQAGRVAAPRKGFYLATFFQYYQRLLRQKKGGACLYMPQDGHWLASFEVITPQKLVFPRPKK